MTKKNYLISKRKIEEARRRRRKPSSLLRQGEPFRYEEKGDIALAHHQGKKALKLYEEAMSGYRKGINRAKEYLELTAEYTSHKHKGVREIAQITTEEDDWFWRNSLKQYKGDYERIKRKHDRIEAALSGKRKYLSGVVSEHHDESGLALKVAGVIGIIGFAGAMTFAYPSITGNAIGNLSNTSSNILALILLALGIGGAFIFFKLK